MHKGNRRVGFHQADGLLQFLVVNPEIIACAVSNKFTTTGEQTIVIIVDYALVVSIAVESYLGITGGIVSADGRGIVRRTVFTYDNLDWLMAFLTEYGVEGTRDGLLLIIGNDDDGYHGIDGG
jgi:hypothetical protein